MSALATHANTLLGVTRRAWRALWRVLRRLWTVVWRLALLVLLLALLGDGTVRATSLRARTTVLARTYLVDYVGWEVAALWGKAKQELLGVQLYLDEAAQRPLVLDYIRRLGEAQALEAQIERAYGDATVADPAAATVSLRAERDALRADLADQQPLVESILEGQVSAVLVDEGFAWLGQVMPPVSMHFTEIPMLLAVSPRDRIELAVDINLNPLGVEAREALEARVDEVLGVSSLVVPLGGISLYPSMVVEPSSRDDAARLARAVEVTAHEWVHHYLAFFPLGLEYTQRAETRILNETTATFFGREIARKVMARYYPDLRQPAYPSFLSGAATTQPSSTSSAAAWPRDPEAPPPFDYYRELHATRTRVDFLLWQGHVESAETYMEAQRRKFARHGYPIRKLNQAYFAFYGGYQGQAGAGGTDPVGPAVEELRLLSPDLQDWLRTLRSITTRQQLLQTVETARGNAP